MRRLLLVLVCVTAVAGCSGAGTGVRRTTHAPTPTPTRATTAASSTGATPTPDRSTTTTSADTRQVVLRPVTAAGRVADGYTATSDSTAVDCSAGTPSPVAQSAGVLYCSPSAASAIACWRAASAKATYCLTDPRSRRLTQYPLAGGFPSAHPSELPPRPIALDLTDGTRCTVRNSGAAGRLATEPDWVPYYFCGNGDSTAVWAAPDSPTGGVTRADGRWAVTVAASDGDGAPHTARVATAYFVGTAA